MKEVIKDLTSAIREYTAELRHIRETREEPPRQKETA